MMKTLAFVLVLALIGVGAYMLLQKDRSFSFSAFGDRVGPLVHKTSDMLQDSQEVQDAKEKTQDFISDVGEKGKETVEDVSYAARKTLYEKVKESVIDPIQKKAEELFGVSEGESSHIERSVSAVVRFDTPESLGVGYIVKQGVATYFDIKNPFYEASGPTAFTISWKDGEMESGQLAEGESVGVVSHVWSRVGEYFIDVAFTHVDADPVHQLVRVVVYE